MEENRETRNEPSCIWSNDFDKGTKTSMGKGESLQQMVLGKLDIHMQMKLDPYTIQTH